MGAGCSGFEGCEQSTVSDLAYVPSEVTQVFPMLRNKFALPTCQISREVYVVVVVVVVVVVKRELVIKSLILTC